MRLAAALLTALAFATAATAVTAAAPASSNGAATEAAIVAKARAFMASYARDLRAGDRAAIARRYDRRGAFFLGNGAGRFQTFAEIEAVYRSEWTPPGSFEWGQLTYVPDGRRAVAITGTFVWVPGKGGAPATYSYIGLLVRGGGGLRIRLEDESAVRAR